MCVCLPAGGGVYFPCLFTYTYGQCPLAGDCLLLPLSTHLMSMLYTINTMYLCYTLFALRLPMAVIEYFRYGKLKAEVALAVCYSQKYFMSQCWSSDTWS